MSYEAADHTKSLIESISEKIDGFFYRCRNDKDFTMLSLSAGFMPTLGYDPHWFISTGQSFAALTHPEDLPRLDAAVTEATRQRRNWRVGYRLRTKSGEYKQVFETGGAFRDPKTGEVQYLDGVILDVKGDAAGSQSLQARTQIAREIGTATGDIMKTLKTLRLLALNARLEAVRAGEHGLGFSIVAREMVDLAAQSDVAARTIERLISKLEDDSVSAAA